MNLYQQNNIYRFFDCYFNAILFLEIIIKDYKYERDI